MIPTRMSSERVPLDETQTLDHRYRAFQRDRETQKEADQGGGCVDVDQIALIGPDAGQGRGVVSWPAGRTQNTCIMDRCPCNQGARRRQSGVLLTWWLPILARVSDHDSVLSESPLPDMSTRRIGSLEPTIAILTGPYACSI
jgi:hypothetical protein